MSGGGAPVRMTALLRAACVLATACGDKPAEADADKLAWRSVVRMHKVLSSSFFFPFLPVLPQPHPFCFSPPPLLLLLFFCFPLLFAVRVDECEEGEARVQCKVPVSAEPTPVVCGHGAFS